MFYHAHTHTSLFMETKKFGVFFLENWDVAISTGLAGIASKMTSQAQNPKKRTRKSKDNRHVFVLVPETYIYNPEIEFNPKTFSITTNRFWVYVFFIIFFFRFRRTFNFKIQKKAFCQNNLVTFNQYKYKKKYNYWAASIILIRNTYIWGNCF